MAVWPAIKKELLLQEHIKVKYDVGGTILQTPIYGRTFGVSSVSNTEGASVLECLADVP